MRILKRKSNLLMAVLACLSVLLLTLGTLFSLPNFGKKNISADAATTDMPEFPEEFNGNF